MRKLITLPQKSIGAKSPGRISRAAGDGNTGWADIASWNI
jgi:hypothetical protein